MVSKKISKLDIKEIVYRNGKKRNFNPNEDKNLPKPLTNFKIDIDYPNLIFRYLTLGFEYFPFNDNMFGIRAPITINNKLNFLESALEFKLYLSDLQFKLIHVGYKRLGLGGYQFYTGVSPVFSKEYTYNNSELSLRAIGGLSLQSIKSVNFSFQFGIGPGYSLKKKIFIMPWNLSFTAGWRFNRKK